MKDSHRSGFGTTRGDFLRIFYICGGGLRGYVRRRQRWCCSTISGRGIRYNLTAGESATSTLRAFTHGNRGCGPMGPCRLCRTARRNLERVDLAVSSGGGVQRGGYRDLRRQWAGGLPGSDSGDDSSEQQDAEQGWAYPMRRWRRPRLARPDIGRAERPTGSGWGRGAAQGTNLRGVQRTGTTTVVRDDSAFGVELDAKAGFGLSPGRPGITRVRCAVVGGFSGCGAAAKRPERRLQGRTWRTWRFWRRTGSSADGRIRRTVDSNIGHRGLDILANGKLGDS